MRAYGCGDRTLILSVYAEGKRTFESEWDVALARVKYDAAGQLEPGRFVRIKAFECEELGFGDTERLHVKPRPGETFPKASRILT